jgi:hypothetical protein
MGNYAPGDYVKVEFRDDRSGHSEWMWVKFDRSDDTDRLVFGEAATLGRNTGYLSWRTRDKILSTIHARGD